MGLQILQLEMERLSLAKAVSDRASKQRLQALDSQLKKLKGEQVSLPCMALTRESCKACMGLHMGSAVLPSCLSASLMQGTVPSLYWAHSGMSIAHRVACGRGNQEQCCSATQQILCI